MTPRDRLQRLLIEHRTEHDPASSEREIIAMFEETGRSKEESVFRAARSEFKTAKQAGLVAGDGRPCPNNHDPDCRWPDCNCRQTNARTAHTKEQA